MVRNNAKFTRKLQGLAQKGYVPLALATTYMKEIDSTPSWEKDAVQPVDSSNDCGNSERIMHHASLRVEGKLEAPVKVENLGTPGKGYIKYGPNDELPNRIYRLFSALPYTAVSVEYNTDVKVGLGPRLMYHGSYYTNGNLKTVCFPYDQAGEWLLGRIAEVRSRISQKQDGEPQQSPDPHTLYIGASAPQEPEKPEIGSDEWLLDRLKKEYEVWHATNTEEEQFMAGNDLNSHFIKCMQDDSLYDLYYPMVGLEMGRKGSWEPKIVSIDHKPTASVRMEEMDADWRINYVYHSSKWLHQQTPKEDEMVAYPAIEIGRFGQQLRQLVSRHRRTPVGQRPTWVSVISRYPSNIHPYYPIPKTYSLIASKVLEYAATLVYDKNVIRQNSTMWGKMVLINLNYFKSICDQRGYSDEEAEAYKLELQNSVNEFLKRRENNGKVLYTDSFLADDGKTVFDAIKIVDIPQNSNVRETKDELEEISSIILFTFGIHPSLIGATPGKNPTSGGTQQRELHLLKQIQVAPRQRLYLEFLNSIARFNGWDSHAVYEIQMPVLTTLDRNASGIEIQ